MSGLLRRLLLLCLLAASVLPLAAQSYVLEIVAPANINSLAVKYSFTIVKSFQSEGGGTGYAIHTATPLSAPSKARLLAEPGVKALDTNSEIDSTETDPKSEAKVKLESLGNAFATPLMGVNYYGNNVLSTYVNQPGATIVELGVAHTTFGAGAGVVAIIDTGVDPHHPALRGALVPGYDFTRDSPDPSELNDLSPTLADALEQSTVELLDSKKFVVSLSQSTVEILDQSTVEILDGDDLPSAFGHGTMVAGLVHLIAPTAQIMPLKAFHADGSATLYDIDRAIRYATDHGANVISMSFSFAASSTVLQAAIDYAHSHGVITISSAGNDAKSVSVFPAAYQQVIGVGSTNFSDHRSPFSNWGISARIWAPGEALVTLFPGGNYAGVWGTSFSTALVSGAVPLMKAIYSGLNYETLHYALESGVHLDDMGARLDLVKSLTYCLHPVPPPDE